MPEFFLIVIRACPENSENTKAFGRSAKMSRLFLDGSLAKIYLLSSFFTQGLKQRCIAHILDWFDCIETTNMQTAMGNYRWSTESVDRDRLFLEYLGVTGK